jgi:hypothetical protein
MQGMPRTVRLFFTVVAGAFLGCATYKFLFALGSWGMRDGPGSDPTATLAYTIVGAVCGLVVELVRRWRPPA